MKQRMTLQGSQGPLSKKEELYYRASQGRAHLFMDMRIVNEEGNELPWDGKAAGELQVRGPHVLKSYFRVSSAAFFSEACTTGTQLTAPTEFCKFCLEKVMSC
jgi:acyl-CoA synthetase (AMP-forming)/AMP-acid ligase II